MAGPLVTLAARQSALIAAATVPGKKSSPVSMVRLLRLLYLLLYPHHSILPLLLRRAVGSFVRFQPLNLQLDKLVKHSLIEVFELVLVDHIVNASHIPSLRLSHQFRHPCGIVKPLDILRYIKLQRDDPGVVVMLGCGLEVIIVIALVDTGIIGRIAGLEALVVLRDGVVVLSDSTVSPVAVLCRLLSCWLPVLQPVSSSSSVKTSVCSECWSMKL